MEDKKYSILELTETLIGRIKPIGLSEYDNICAENIETYKDVVHGMIDRLIDVSKSNYSPYGSESNVGRLAKDFLEEVVDTINESL